jgi:hypothetical protein
MEWNEYKILSEKTLSTQFNCDVKEQLLLHAVIGILTELDELSDWNGDEVNKKEEVADAFWYVAILDRELDLNLNLPNKKSNLTQLKNDKFIFDLYKQSCQLLDFLKKKLYYNKPIDLDKFKYYSQNIFDTLNLFCEFNGVNVPTILDTNIAKLKARYGEKFSSDKAITRDLEKERQILEQ